MSLYLCILLRRDPTSTLFPYTTLFRSFTPFQECKTIANHTALISKLTIVWGAKESLYKIYGKKKLRFLEHIFIDDFKFEDERTIGEIRFENETESYCIYFLEFEGFTCVYAF